MILPDLKKELEIDGSLKFDASELTKTIKTKVLAE